MLRKILKTEFIAAFKDEIETFDGKSYLCIICKTTLNSFNCKLTDITYYWLIDDGWCKLVFLIQTINCKCPL